MRILLCVLLLLTVAAAPMAVESHTVYLPIITNGCGVCSPVGTQAAIEMTRTAMPTPAPSATLGGPLLGTPTPHS